MNFPHLQGYGLIRSRKGSSLIVVLASLMLLLVLILAFMASVSTELKSSKMYANGSSLRLLAQSSVNLVIGQLRVATSDSKLCWASQPGMIRTYDSAGQPSAFYKLYSGDSMQGSGLFNATVTGNAVPTDWFSQKGVYVDLNQPVTIDSVNYYPIVHGEPSDYQTYTPPFDPGVGSENSKVLKSSTGVSTDPSDVSGFWLKKDTPVDSTSPNVAPMPVKWLYVLQDGRVIVPDSNPVTGKVTFNSAGTKPSLSNPIVGRMAFWTDDETAKVNINTASEGVFWDTPRTYTYQDWYMGTHQPLQNEFQRYPGHPAQVSLSAVLRIKDPTRIWDPVPDPSPITYEEIYPITPATKIGGSKAGSIPTTGLAAGSSSVKRLYTTVDEFLFQMDLNSGIRKKNSQLIPSFSTALSQDTLRKSHFFLTANSQAPDVNVFNLPRVSMWPITLNKTTSAPAMSAYDKLISFCSTVNDHIFYFQRKDPNSPTVDLPTTGNATGLGRNRQLLEYLRKLTDMSIPGFGSGKFSAKYGDDRQQILTEIFDYIRSTNMRDSVTGAYPYTEIIAPAPASNSTASSTYRAGLGQVIPIVDKAITIPDPQNSGINTNPRGFGRFPTLQQAALVFIGVRDGSDTPDPSVPPPGTPAPTKFSPVTSIAPGFTGYPDAAFAPIPFKDPANPAGWVQRVQAAFIVQTFDPSQGPTAVYPWYEIEVEDLDKLNWSNTAGGSYPMLFPSSGVISKPYTVLQGTSVGGMNDFRHFTQWRSSSDATKGTTKYPFVTPPTGAPGTSPDMLGSIYFKGGTVKLTMYALKSDGTRDTAAGPLQSFTLTFPAATIPAPTTIVDSTKWSFASNKANTNFRSFYTEGSNIGRFNIPLANAMLGSNDSIRALVATPGDMRLVAPRSVVPSGFFQKLSNYSTATDPRSHMLRFGYNFPVYGSFGSKLVNVTYNRYASPFNSNDTWWAGSAGASSPLPPNATVGSTSGNRMKDTITAVSTTGVTGPGGVPADWDNGISNLVDGSYINKADEGDAGTTAPTNYKPYIEFDYGDGIPGDSFFSPNKMIPSPGTFGSLPTGVWSFKAWQTLLFRPGPAGHAGLGTETTPSPSGTPASPPFSSPPDYLLMDLFNMPVVEPYAISTPLATSGRINLNYQIIPFTYIHRDTGLRAAMKAQMVTAISTIGYKLGVNTTTATPGGTNGPTNAKVRFPINADSTLAQFDKKFSTNNVFRAPAEICAVDIMPSGATGVPAAATRSSMDSFWLNNYALTGDNSRERPYTNLYPLLTTKSNTFTVHYRVQLLKPAPGGDFETWREGRDQVTGQYRGSQTVERYIDPNDTIPDYATDDLATAQPLSQFYKFRVIATHQFAP